MPELRFQVEAVEPLAAALAPTLSFHLRVTNDNGREPIHALVLRCQIQIEAPRRRYSSQEATRLAELFGRPEDWGRTLRNLLWAQVALNVPAFLGSAEIELPLPCGGDPGAAIPQYFDALEQGEVPLRLLFSGTAFYGTEARALQVAPISWNCEATFRMPVSLWQAALTQHSRNRAWIAVAPALGERLTEYRTRHGIATWDEALERLLAAAEMPLESELTR